MVYKMLYQNIFVQQYQNKNLLNLSKFLIRIKDYNIYNYWSSIYLFSTNPQEKVSQFPEYSSLLKNR